MSHGKLSLEFQKSLSMQYSELIARVVNVLDKQGNYAKEAQSLCLSSKGIMIALGGLQIFEKEMKNARHAKQNQDRRKHIIVVHPLQALEDTMAVQWRRSCVVYTIRYNGHIFLPRMNFSPNTMSMREFFASYKDSMKGLLNLAREQHVNPPYTFHIVSRYPLVQCISLYAIELLC